jgi:hypothetical protein
VNSISSEKILNRRTLEIQTPILANNLQDRIPIKFREIHTLLAEAKLSLFTILIDHREEKENKLETVVEIDLFLNFSVSKRLIIVRLKFSNSLQLLPT